MVRRIYCSNGPNDVWHCDGYDKIKQYGFPIHGGVDGFSRKILWFYILNVPKFYYRLELVKQVCNFLQVVFLLTPVSKHEGKIKYKGLQIALSLTNAYFIILGSDFRITFKISFSENLTVLKNILVCSKS